MTESHGEHEVAATVSIESERGPEPGSTTSPSSAEADADGGGRAASETSGDTGADYDDLPDISDLFAPESDGDAHGTAPLSGDPPLPHGADHTDTAGPHDAASVPEVSEVSDGHPNQPPPPKAEHVILLDGSPRTDQPPDRFETTDQSEQATTATETPGLVDTQAIPTVDHTATPDDPPDLGATQAIPTVDHTATPDDPPDLGATQAMPIVSAPKVTEQLPPSSGTDGMFGGVPVADGPAPTSETPSVAARTEPSPAIAAATTTVQPMVTVSAPPARSGRGLLAVVGVAVGALVLLVAAWAVDSIRTSDSVMRGTMLGTTSIGGLTEAELAEVLLSQNSALGQEAVVLQVGETALSSDPLTLGASLDNDAITEEALAARRGGPLPLRPFTWVGTFFSNEVLEKKYIIDPSATEAATEELITTSLTPAEEPQLELRGGEFVVIDGVDGVRFDAAEIVQSLPAALEQPAPYELTLTALAAVPLITNEEIQAVAAEASRATGGDLIIQVLDQRADLPMETLRSWVEMQIVDDQPTWRINRETALEDLKPLFPTLGSEDQRARFNIVDGKPIIIPASETVICCTDESIGKIRERLLEEPPPPPSNEEDTSDDESKPVIIIEPTVVGADEGVAELTALGIVEEVSTFTTNHACCENRVTNIHRFADLVRGAVIRPGEDFSLNEYVGQRTTAKGFVADGAIINGVLEPQVGGGVSQFATTFFNAAFYAGVDFNTYQSHSLYISRYPRGREATISWRHPDLSIKNTTDYGILVWPTYTSTSITVTFYSTKHIEVVDLPLLSSSRGECSVYTTPRVRTYPDGTKDEDSVFALYRPGEGLDCNGNSTVPEEEPAGPSAAPTPAPNPTTPTTAPVATTQPVEQLPSSTLPG